eukprot:15335391-Ditylum_brightwellii.AAC.1
MMVTPETLVIGYEISTGQYAAEGWVLAKKTPVLREACSSWHYEEKGTIKGPVTCRELANEIRAQRSKEKGGVEILWENMRVWSTELTQLDEESNKEQQQWRKISELIFLKAAMEAFEDNPPQWSLGEISEEKGEHIEKGKGGDAQTMAPNGDFDPSAMTYTDPTVENNGLTPNESKELEAFLSSTANMGPAHTQNGNAAEENDEEGYE